MSEPLQETGYVSSLAPRRVPLLPPGPPPSRWSELGALLHWISDSWLRAADADATWEQGAGREHHEP
jgi:hypothetical protein